jgi:hypothetical protein
MKEFKPAKRHIEVSVGESVRILRELQELSQNELADIMTASAWAWKEPRPWPEHSSVIPPCYCFQAGISRLNPLPDCRFCLR